MKLANVLYCCGRNSSFPQIWDFNFDIKRNQVFFVLKELKKIKKYVTPFHTHTEECYNTVAICELVASFLVM